MIKPIRILLYLFLLVQYSTATARQEPVLFDHYTSLEGLSNNDVRKIYKDHNGFVWIGTEYGLNRFDGSKFKVYRHIENDNTSLLNNSIYDIIEDKWGNIWIGTLTGLCRLNPLLETFTRIAFPGSQKQSRIDIPAIKKLVFNPFERSLWICTTAGLFTINIKTDELIPAQDKDPRRLLSRPINCIYFAGPDEVWLGTEDGLLIYHPFNGTYEKISHPVVENKLLDRLSITCIYPGDDNHYWIGTHGAGLLDIDSSSKQWTGQYLPEPQSGIQRNANIIQDIAATDLPGQENKLWIASESSALHLFDKQQKKFYPYQASHGDDKYGVFESARNFYYAKEEGLWIASTHGVYRYDPNRQMFHTYPFHYSFPKNCLSQPVMVYPDPVDGSGNTLLISTRTCGLFKYFINERRLEEFTEIFNAILPVNTLSMLRDQRGILWLATENDGLIEVDDAAKRIITYTGDYGIRPQLDDKTIYSIKQDINHRLWIGTNKGFYVLDADRKTITPVTWDLPGNMPGELAAAGTDICFDRLGNAWLLRSEPGKKLATIGKIQPGTYTATAIYNLPGNENSFPEPSELYKLACTNDNRIWCASSKGLITWPAENDKPVYTRYKDSDGLSATQVYNFIKDDAGCLWITTVGGLSMYDPKNMTFRNFPDLLYGLDKESNGRLFYNSITREVMLGYPGKLYGLPIDKLSRKLPAPNVLITEFRVDNVPYFTFGKKVSNNAYIELDANQNLITIDFAALSYTNASQNRFAYKLDGFDKNWIHSTNTSISYKLTDGRYILHIKASNADGAWSNEEASLEIIIRPPFYKTWWFITSCFLLAAALVYFLVRIRIKRLKEVYQVRNVIARDLHDEIGSTLTSINILSQVSRSNIEKDQAKTARLLGKITEQSEEIQQNMSDIVWAIKPDNDKIENMVVRMREYLAHTLEPKNIRLSFTTDEAVLKMSLTMQQRRDFFLVFKEAINNMVRHSACSEAVIALARNNGHVVLQVNDNGRGFDPSKQTSSNGLKNMQQRAALLKGSLAIQSAAGQGTRVRLAIPATS